MQRVFNSPMSAYRLGNLLGIGRQTADEETSLDALAPLELSRLLNHGDACEATPVRFLFQPVNLAAGDAPA